MATTLNQRKNINSNNHKMLNPKHTDYPLRWPSSNGQHRNDDDSKENKVLGSTGEVSIVSTTDATVHKSKKKRFHRKLIFGKNFLRLKKSKSSSAKSDQSCEKDENANSAKLSGTAREFSKSDENLIRIQVSANGEGVDSDCRESCISRIFVEYNPEADLYDTDSDIFDYNEKAVDVPEDFVRNQWICRRRWKPDSRCDSYQESVRSFLSEDWISSQTSFPRDSYNSQSNKSYDIDRTSIPDKYRIPANARQMGAGCSNSCYPRSVAPARSASPSYVEYGPRRMHKIALPARPALQATSNSYSNLHQLNLFDSPKNASSTIQEDNILHRRNNAFGPKHHSSLLELSTVTTTKSKTSPRPIATDSQSIKHPRPRPQSIAGGFLKNFGGSVQNLVPFGRDRGRMKSVSENNLAGIPKNKLNRKTNSVVFGCETLPSALNNDVKVDKPRGAVKKFFDMNLAKLKRSKDQRKVIQDIDGGFFERFGSLLRQKSELEDTHMPTPLAPLPEEADQLEDNVMAIDVAPRMLCAINEAESDSGNETLHESDSEHDDREKHESFIGDVVGMNIDELYEEVLYEILHGIGCEASTDVCQEALFDYVQEAFKITSDRHEEMLQAAGIKEPPEIRLNVEVIKAENLVPKDSNGFSDPFVTLYLESCTTHRYNTSVKSSTLNPLWEEHFSLPIPDNPNNEILVVEVWDFDAAETVTEKFNKFFEVKGIRGLRKLMKEIAVTASTGKHDNEFIGRTAIPLKSIPANGIKVWYNLEKGSRTKSRGSILIRMSFSAEKNNRVAMQEHKHLLRILLMHELETSKVAPFWWRGKFSGQGEAILTQHSAQSALNEQDCALAQWSVYAHVHQDHQLSFGLFNTILDKIIPLLQTLPDSNDDVKSFWEGAKRLLPSCFSVIRKIRKRAATDKNSIKMLMEALDIISKIATLDPPEGTDLFPKQIYGWITKDDDEPNCDIRMAMRDAVNSGATEWFEHVNEGSECPNGIEEDRLQHLIKLIQLIRSDLQKAIELYDKQFQQKLRFHYAQTLYLFYEKKLAEQVQPVVEEVCKNIKRIRISEDKLERLPELDDINMGTTLFELYLVLKRFTTLGTALCPGVEELNINKYYLWFTTGVSHWLDISVYKALTRIEKAIDLDKLVPVDETVKYSSSAVDTLAIFYQIKIFWQQLGWPDVEGAYMFVGKIVDDICRCCVYYADKMARRVDELCIEEHQDGFEVTREWCLAINNIDYIRQSLPPFMKELGLDDIIARLAEFRSSLEADRCAETLKNVVENAIDTTRNKIIQLIEVVARKMCPAMRRFLVQGAEVLHEGSHSMERLLIYMEESLKTLNTELNEVNFERILDAIWTELSTILYEVVQSSLDKKRPPAFFANLRDTLHLMITSFKSSQNTSSSDKETLENIERTLELHAYETGDLIHQYYMERLNDQKNMEDCPYGELTIICNFVDNKLVLEIMNARDLLPMDSNGTCDSFVKIHFIPSDKFLTIGTHKTSVHSKTLFPLYDEKFVINLTPEQRSMSNALIVFSVKDHDYFGMSNQYIAECYMSFGEVENSDGEQVHMKLSRPIYKNSDCIRALEYRTGDKQARDFLKKLKQKSANNS